MDAGRRATGGARPGRRRYGPLRPPRHSRRPPFRTGAGRGGRRGRRRPRRGPLARTVLARRRLGRPAAAAQLPRPRRRDGARCRRRRVRACTGCGLRAADRRPGAGRPCLRGLGPAADPGRAARLADGPLAVPARRGRRLRPHRAVPARPPRRGLHLPTRRAPRLRPARGAGRGRRGGLAARRPPLPRRPRRDRSRLVPGRLAAVSGRGRRPEVAYRSGPPAPRPRRDGRTSRPGPEGPTRRSGGAGAVRAFGAHGADAARCRRAAHWPGSSSSSPARTGGARSSRPGSARRWPARRPAAPAAAPGRLAPRAPPPTGTPWTSGAPDPLPLFPLQPPRTGAELLADHVTAMVCCAAVDTAGAAPGLDWLDGPALLVDGERRGGSGQPACSAWSRTGTPDRCVAGSPRSASAPRSPSASCDPRPTPSPRRHRRAPAGIRRGRVPFTSIRDER